MPRRLSSSSDSDGWTPSAVFLFSSPRFPPFPLPRLPLGGTGTGGSCGLLHTCSHPLARRRSSFLELGRTLHQVFSEQGPGVSGLTGHFNFSFLNLFDVLDPAVVFSSWGTQACHCSGFSFATWVQGPPGFGSCDAQAYLLQGTWDFSPPVGDRTPVCCTVRRVPHHWAHQGSPSATIFITDVETVVFPRTGPGASPSRLRSVTRLVPTSQFSSVARSCPTLRRHGLQHARPPCPSPTPGLYSNPCPSSR